LPEHGGDFIGLGIGHGNGVFSGRRVRDLRS
jgi:hypothetical protein